ncbi:MAG: Ig-like domain-containing protein [Gemmatimonadetes bacterium]|nr:Ig-like domain-containing protein [Gemmatimonadota bacterium]
MMQFRTRSLVRRARLSVGARAFLPLAVLALAALSACGDDPSSPTIPGKISRVGGDSQSVVAGTVMANPMVVEVLAQNGKPLAGQTVTWSLATGASGTLPSSTSITDATGRASLGFTAGTVAGKAEITAIVGSLQGTIFLQQVVAGPASLLAKFAGDGTAGLAGAGVQVVVKVTDVHGNAVSG